MICESAFNLRNVIIFAVVFIYPSGILSDATFLMHFLKLDSFCDGFCIVFLGP